jgi:hypothetical protein
MNFTEALNEVIAKTKRPDKSAESASALNRAILFYSLKGEFPQDMVEDSIPIDATLYGATIPLDFVTRFRKFVYIKRPSHLGYLTPIGADKVMTPTHTIQKDVYFIAGNNFTYVLKSLSPSLEIGYFQTPAILSDTDTCWLLDVIPWAIIDKAAGSIFQAIGDETSWRAHETASVELFLAYRRSMPL